MPQPVQRADGGWDFILSEVSFDRCSFFYQKGIYLVSEKGKTGLRLWSTTLLNLGGREYTIDPNGTNYDSSRFLLKFLGKKITNATSSTEGNLILTFEDGSTLTTYSDEKYDTWEFAGVTDGEPWKFECLEGGNLFQY